MKTGLSSRKATTFALLVVTLVSTAISCFWAMKVPFFQRPDELAHADYAFTLLDVGQPYRISNPSAAFTPVAPQVSFLENAVGYRAMRYNPFARAPRNYGTAVFIASVDAAAPSTNRVAVQTGSRMPYVMFAYPCAYYVLTASVLWIAQKLFEHSIWKIFQTARLFNSCFLLATLPLAFSAFREIGLRPKAALLLTAAIGFFPLVSWVSGYIQPDNLSFLLITVITYLMLRIHRHGVTIKRTSLVAVCLGALLFTKQHYGVALWIPSLALIAMRPAKDPKRSLLLSILIITIVPALSLPLSLSATPVISAQPTSNANLLRQKLQHDFRLSSLVEDSTAGIFDEYVRGAGFNDYWFYDFRDFRIYGNRVQALLAPIIGAASLVTITLFLLSIIRIISRIVRVATLRKSLSLLLRLISSGFVVNAYLLTTVAILAAFAITQRQMWLEGRYWYPVIVPLLIVLSIYIPKLARPNYRRGIANGVASAAFLVSICLAPVALAAMLHDYYSPVDRLPANDSLAGVTEVNTTPYSGDAKRHLTIVRGRTVTIYGYAVDLMTGLPAKHVAVVVDGLARAEAITGAAQPTFLSLYNDGELTRSGFAIKLRTNRWKVGNHSITFSVRSDNGVSIPFTEDLKLKVVIETAVRRRDAGAG